MVSLQVSPSSPQYLTWKILERMLSHVAHFHLNSGRFPSPKISTLAVLNVSRAAIYHDDDALPILLPSEWLSGLYLCRRHQPVAGGRRRNGKYVVLRFDYTAGEPIQDNTRKYECRLVMCRVVECHVSWNSYNAWDTFFEDIVLSGGDK